MNIIFTGHAEKQLGERGISKNAVVDVVRGPGQVIPQQEGIIMLQSVYYEHNKRYILRVAVKRENNGLLVLTAYRTSKIAKYWRGDL